MIFYIRAAPPSPPPGPGLLSPQCRPDAFFPVLLIESGFKPGAPKRPAGLNAGAGGITREGGRQERHR